MRRGHRPTVRRGATQSRDWESPDLDPEAAHSRSAGEYPEAEPAPIMADASHEGGTRRTPGGPGTKPAPEQDSDVKQRGQRRSQGSPHRDQSARAGRSAGSDPRAGRQRPALPMLLSRFRSPRPAARPEPPVLPHVRPAARLSKNWPWLAFLLWGIPARMGCAVVSRPEMVNSPTPALNPRGPLRITRPLPPAAAPTSEARIRHGLRVRGSGHRCVCRPPGRVPFRCGRASQA